MQKFSIKNFFLLFSLIVAILLSFYLNKKDNEPIVEIPDMSYLQNDINKYLIDKSGTLEINYILPDYIYLNIDELYNDFFTELFYYSYNYSDTSKLTLAKYGVHSLGDTLRICKTWTGGARGLPLVGQAFGVYFLKSKSHGTFNDARETNTFVGYCLNNNKFVDMLYYFKTFFYYWRVDEGYPLSFDEKGYSPATDFFLYPDISLIDIAKFFFYYSRSLPLNILSKNNIPSLYNEIPGLLKTPFSKTVSYNYSRGVDSVFILPNTFDCYGFSFEGWYTSPDFEGEPIAKFDKYEAMNYGSNITLYAKFSRTGKFSTEMALDSVTYNK